MAARKELGRVADEVRRTGEPVVLTRRGKPVARIAPEPTRAAVGGRDPLARLRGSLEVVGSLADVQLALRDLRREAGRSLGRRGKRRE